MKLATRFPMPRTGRGSPPERGMARQLLNSMRDGIERVDAVIGSLSGDRMASHGFDRIRSNLKLISVCIWRARWL